MWTVAAVSWDIRFAADGMPALEARRRLGLPEGSEGEIYLKNPSLLTSERACRMWPGAIDTGCDLPACLSEEKTALFQSGLLTLRPSEGGKAEVIFTASAEEVVLFRKAWAAERRAMASEAHLDCRLRCRQSGDCADCAEPCDYAGRD